ncbi:hypothetical protein ACK3SF_02555 [Candidatus Nanosalina sp. VS9-1]|uniref:hypothetical protein n=1 Tax=Candidatus Nanosalina sp. VS9-1 TaxID=3388566 RepID=UPI0039DF99F8
MSSQARPETTFERVQNAAPEKLYDDIPELTGLDERYVVFEYDLGGGVGVIPSEEIKRILEEGREQGEIFPVFRGIEASEAYVRNAVENGEGLMTARLEDGEVYSTGYMIDDEELKGLMTFSTD